MNEKQYLNLAKMNITINSIQYYIFSLIRQLIGCVGPGMGVQPWPWTVPLPCLVLG